MQSLPTPVGAAGASAPASDGSADSESLYHRLGELTRTLHEALRELGYDRHLEAAVSTLPEARSRLSYIAKLTGEAADKVLNAVDTAKADQDALAESARKMAENMRRDPVGAVARGEVLNFVDAVRASCDRTSAHLTDIMMAQDFHDLTGQVTRKLVGMAQHLEGDLLKLLLEAAPPAQKPQNDGWLNGPAHDAEHRDDVVTDQKQVDDLLESLGF